MVPTALVFQKTEGSAECMQGLICERQQTFEKKNHKLGAEFARVDSSGAGTSLPLLLNDGKHFLIKRCSQRITIQALIRLVA